MLKHRLGAGLVLGLALLLAGAGLAQTEPPATPPPAPVEPAAPAAPAVAPSPEKPPAPKAAETKVRRHKLDEVVAIWKDGLVKEGESAEQVVVIRGDSTIQGDVRGDVVVIFGKLEVTGNVDGDVVVVLGEAEINGHVGGDLTLVMTPSHLGSKTDVRGHTVAVGSAPQRDPGARLRRSAEIVSLEPVMGMVTSARDYLFQGVLLLRPFPPRLGWAWVVAGALLIFHLLLAAVFAHPLRGCVETLHEQPARSFLIGLVAFILVGPLTILLSFTVVAMPLIFLTFLALTIFGRLTVYAGAGMALGQVTGVRGLTHPVIGVLVGSVLFYLSYMIPVVGAVVYFVLLPWGMGAALIRIFDALRRERRPVGTGRDFGVPSGTLGAEAAGPATRGVGIEPGLVDPGSAAPSSAGAAGSVPPVIPLPPIDVLALPRVGFWPRCAATLIDLLVVAFLNALIFHHTRSFWLLLGLYHVVMWGWTGTTLGGSILRLRIVRLDGRPVDWSTAAVRLLGSVVSLLALGIGFLWASWDDQMQSWHDRIAGTTIVRTNSRSSLV